MSETNRNDYYQMTFFSRAQAYEQLKGLEILSFVEKDEDGTTAAGVPKHWHSDPVSARRPSS